MTRSPQWTKNTKERKQDTHRLLLRSLPRETELSTLLPNLSLTDRLVPAADADVESAYETSEP